MSISGKTVLVFIAHPDDEVQSAGTLAKLVKDGNTVHMCIATDGDKGVHTLEIKPHELVDTRKREMAEVAGIIGLSEIIWLGFSDGSLELLREELKERVFRTIRRYKPDVVISFDGWTRWDPHSDHRTIGQVSTEAAYLADGLWYYPQHHTEGLLAHRVSETYLFASEEPNYVVDITPFYGQRLACAQAYRSQWKFDYDERMTKRLNDQGRPITDKYREGFRRIRNEGLDL
jgi:LmbE family N-acetylglucosaminyl deacetylase